MVSTRAIFVSRETHRHFQFPIFWIRDDPWSVVGRLFWCRRETANFPPVAFVAESEKGAAQLRRIMINSAKTELSFAKEVRWFRRARCLGAILPVNLVASRVAAKTD